MRFFNNSINKILAGVLVILAAFIAFEFVFTNGGDDSIDTVTSDARVNPNISTIYNSTQDEANTDAETEEPTEQEITAAYIETTDAPPTTLAPTTAKPTTAAKSTKSTKATVSFATAIPPTAEADYEAQWDAGYLVAIDNPDTYYACSHVELSDEDRDLLERLCMGEFGSGGFIGAALIAQAVKDAMCFDGYTSVAEIIKECHYTGSTDKGTNDECKSAVSYIFDRDHDAVQHRIMYMYNPELVESSFHESQNYILTYESVRFFDRWNY